MQLPKFKQVRSPLLAAAILVVGLLFITTGCADSNAGDPVSNTPAVARPSTTSSTPVATLVANASPALPTQTAEIDDEMAFDEESRPTPTATWPAQSQQVPCGAILPILSSGPSPLDGQINASAVAELVPDSARPALQRLLSSPEHVGLVAYEVGREQDGAYLNPDTPMPLASVVKIINLIAYADAASAGQFDPAEWVPLSEMERYYLPRTDLGAHNRALMDLEERHLIALEPPATPLEEIPWMMIRHSSNAAADYLHLRLGQQVIEQTIVDLGLDSHTAPCPWIGQFLMMSNRQTPTDNRRAVQRYMDDPEQYGGEVVQMAESFASDESFRAAESSPGWRASLNTQILFSDNLNAQASAADYASLMARILGNQLSSGYTNIVVRRALEWPMAFPVNQELFSVLGLKDGSLPGVLTTAYYAQRLEDGAQVVVVLFFRQLPRETYREWRRDLPHDELARWLLSDPEAIPALRRALQPVG